MQVVIDSFVISLLISTSMSTSVIKLVFSFCHKIGEELIKKWHSVAKEEHIPLRQHMMAAALKSIVRTSFGEDYMTSNKEILQIEKDYDLVRNSTF